MLADGTITAPELLELYLERIARMDRELRSFRVVLADSARQEAGVAQDRLNAGERLPLLGVPIAIKDDVDVAGEVTTYGTAAHGPAVAEDAEVVRRLRAAGAVIVGKTTVPEMMIWSFTETMTFGATRNPWNTDYAPGGSSGGSGAAVAAGLASMALGSDGMGSIRIPSTWCGLFGIKPQRDRVPLAPHDDAWNGLSVNGPMARTVEDAALFLDVTAPGDGFVEAAKRPPGQLRIALSTKAPPGLIVRVGRPSGPRSSEAGALLRELGHQVITRDPDYPLSGVYGHALPRYFRGVYDDVKTLPRSGRLKPRTRAFARIGGLISDRRMNAIRGAESEVAERVQSILRRRRRGCHAGDGDRPVADRGIPAARSALDADIGGRPGAVSGDVQCDGPAGGGGAVGLGWQGPADVDPVGGQAVRRGNAAVAGRADRARAAVGRPPPAGVLTNCRERACLPATRRQFVAVCARSWTMASRLPRPFGPQSRVLWPSLR